MTIADRVADVRSHIAAACQRSGRPEGAVRLTAVSKTHPAEAVLAAIDAGVDAIGENRVQEAAGKRRLLPARPEWRLIGSLQQNKARLALETFDVIETVDRVAIADRLESLLAGSTRIVPVLIEVNVGAEVQKGGAAPDSVLSLAGHLIERCPHLRFEGLMTVPPYDPDPSHSRPFFSALRRLGEQMAIVQGLPQVGLSMGMSEDFEIAVEEGATEVRLGRIIFGER